jgi:hypothetical protein
MVCACQGPHDFIVEQNCLRRFNGRCNQRVREIGVVHQPIDSFGKMKLLRITVCNRSASILPARRSGGNQLEFAGLRIHLQVINLFDIERDVVHFLLA